MPQFSNLDSVQYPEYFLGLYSKIHKLVICLKGCRTLLVSSRKYMSVAGRDRPKY